MATFLLPRKRFKCSECSFVVFSHPVALFFQFFECSLVSIIMLLLCLLVFRSSIVIESFLPSLASHENEKHSTMISFVVECRCLVSSILMSEQPSVNVCFTKWKKYMNAHVISRCIYWYRQQNPRIRVTMTEALVGQFILSKFTRSR